MRSQTYGEVSLKEIAEIIKDRTMDTPGEHNLMIGTDSQNFDKTRMVLVVALHHVGHGGIFFYEIINVPRINNIGQKLIYETNLSLDLATKLVHELEELVNEGYDYNKYINIGIHVDAGENGPSRQSIPEIVGWVKACGYNVITKPDSYAASSIANKYSK